MCQRPAVARGFERFCDFVMEYGKCFIILVTEYGCDLGFGDAGPKSFTLFGLIIGTIPNKKNAFWGPFFAHIFRHYQGKIKAI